MEVSQPFLVYRDRIGVPSELAFLRRQYIGFTRLRPVWIGRTLLPDASLIGGQPLLLGGDLPLGPLHRALFRYLRYPPPALPTGLAPVLHAQFARGGALALPLAQKLGLRLVVTLHGGDVSKAKNWRRTLLARRWPALLQQARHFVCVSAAVAEVAERRGVPPAKLVVLPIGVEMPNESPRRQPASHLPARHLPAAHLFVGRFVEKKGITVLADAIRRLRAEGDRTPLVCVGDGPLRPILEALARDVPAVTLTGWLPGEAVRSHMMEAVSLLVPSIIAADGDAEGLPSVVVEAMALGCPVIGSNQGGIAEAISHDRTGLLVPPGDAGALAAAMHHVAADGALAARIGAAGFAKARDSFDARIQSAKLEELLLSA